MKRRTVLTLQVSRSEGGEYLVEVWPEDSPSLGRSVIFRPGEVDSEWSAARCAVAAGGLDESKVPGWHAAEPEAEAKVSPLRDLPPTRGWLATDRGIFLSDEQIDAWVQTVPTLGPSIYDVAKDLGNLRAAARRFLRARGLLPVVESLRALGDALPEGHVPS